MIWTVFSGERCGPWASCLDFVKNVWHLNLSRIHLGHCPQESFIGLSCVVATYLLCIGLICKYKLKESISTDIGTGTCSLTSKLSKLNQVYIILWLGVHCQRIKLWKQYMTFYHCFDNGIQVMHGYVTFKNCLHLTMAM